QADFSYNAEWDPKHRRINPDLAGGAILDVGVYPIALAYWLMGKEPTSVSSTALIGKTGVDEQSAYLFGYDQGEIAVLSSAVHTDGPKEAVIIGEKGRIRVPLFWKADTAIFEAGDEEIERIHHPYPASGLQYQAAAAMEALRAGKKEEEKMPWKESLRIMRMMDRCRQQWNMRYPWEA
ncbi:MAG: Gfo/Idh/MocA family oxidoreductase, partial [Bacteroidota bacterium]